MPKRNNYGNIVAVISIAILSMIFSACSNVENASVKDQSKFEKYLPDFEIINQVMQKDKETKGMVDEIYGNFYEVDSDNGVLGYYDPKTLEVTSMQLTTVEKDALKAIDDYFARPFDSVRVIDNRIVYRATNTAVIYTTDGQPPQYSDTANDEINDMPLIKFDDHWYYYSDKAFSNSQMFAIIFLTTYRIPLIIVIVAIIAIIVFLAIRRRMRREQKGNA